MTRFRLRAERAGLLAERYPASGESLRFFAAVSLYQDTGEGLDVLRDLVRVEILEESAWFQRILREMRPGEPPAAPPKANECPRCGNGPQLAVLRPLADGTSFSLACSLCRHEWQFPRTECPACGESGGDKIQFARAEEFPAAQTMTCDSCRMYLHVIDISKDEQAIPEADEIAAQPLDVWAMEQGYRKMISNLVGL